jgi:GT2 family glycosyltransferase
MAQSAELFYFSWWRRVLGAAVQRWEEGVRPLVSVIIVLYNSAEHIGPCIASLGRLSYEPIEVIMVDNGSKDDSPHIAAEAARAGGLEFVMQELPRNRGFAAANNRGFALARGEVLLLLNPDTEVFPDTVDELVDGLREPTAAVAGCKIYYPDRKTIQHAGGYVRDNGLTMHYGADQPDEGQFDEMKDVAYVTGAALAVLRDVFVRAGMLDEGYFPAYFEETDLCLRVRRLGYRVVYVPGARLVHHESTTTGKFTRRYYYLYHRNRIRFMLKNYSWRFLRDRALPMEERWLDIITPWEQAVPLNKGYLVNIMNLPRTLLARRRMERMLGVPRLEDTVSHFQ